MLSRRQLLQRGGALAAGFALPVAPDFGAGNLRKLIDIGPGGVIDPGSPQDYRAYSNRTYFADTQTGWIRMWADWPSLQPSQAYGIDDPASPGYAKLQALDAQIGQACADGLRVLLLPYRHPTWANGTSWLVPDSDAEIAFAPADRMSSAAWDKYVANGRVSNPSRRALEYRVPAEGYPLDGSWSRFFEFLYRRYHWGQRASGRYVHGFELVNEPNLQLWPQRAPSASDSELGSRLVTTYEDFTRDLLDAFPATGYAPHSQQAWSLHNYGDVEQRVTTRTQRVRDLLRWRWTGYAEPGAPTVFVTEGGARIGKMRKLYPREDPLLAQATSLQTAWSLHSTDTGGGAGVAMLAQYLLYADPNYDCGLLEPAPATVKRPAYAVWKTFPRSV